MAKVKISIEIDSQKMLPIEIDREWESTCFFKEEKQIYYQGQLQADDKYIGTVCFSLFKWFRIKEEKNNDN